MLTLVALALVSHLPTDPGSAILSAPAGTQKAMVVPGGRTVLPNGRFLTPHGKRLYGGENVWATYLHPHQKALVLAHDGGITVYPDAEATRPVRTLYTRKETAPAGAFTPDGKRFVLSLGDDGAVEILNASNWTTEGTIDANDSKFKDSYINDLVVSPSGRLAYGVDVANQRVVTFDLHTMRVADSVKAGRQPYAIALSEDGKRLFVANIGLFDYSLIPKPREGEGDPRGITRPPFAFPSDESKNGVEMEGRRVPGIGDPRVPDAQSIYLYGLADSAKPLFTKSTKAGLLIHAPADGGKAVGGSAPNALLVRGSDLFVSNANSDTVQMFDSRSLKLKRTVKLTPSPLVAKLRGVMPSGMALNKAGDRLYVCESGLNAVAVINPVQGKVLGHIPTGWFPVQVRLSSSQKTLYVATQKGLGRGPRGPLNPRDTADERYGLPDMPGMVDAVPAPQPPDLDKLTAEVMENNGIVDRRAGQTRANPVPLAPGRASDKIKYVVFITKENHTFDGIFGGLKGADGEPEYAQFGMKGWIAENGRKERLPIMPNHLRLAEQFAISDNFYMEPQASGDGHRWLIGVYPSIWTTRVFYSGWSFRPNDEAKGRLVSFGSNGSQIPEDYLENGSMWEHLERSGITFRNYGEGFEFPSANEARDAGPTGVLEVANYPVNKALWDNTCWTFPIFNMEIPDVARADWFVDDLESKFRKGGKPIPQFINITLCNDHGAKARPEDGYPYVCSFMADNDLALGRTVEYLSHLPEWKEMLILVTQDDSGADNDHVDRHRSFVLAISPWAKRGYVSHVHTSIMSCLKTIYAVFGLGPNNMFDALASDLSDMLTDTPDFTPYTWIRTRGCSRPQKLTIQPTPGSAGGCFRNLRSRWMTPILLSGFGNRGRANRNPSGQGTHGRRPGHSSGGGPPASPCLAVSLHSLTRRYGSVRRPCISASRR
jgi:hypothetical protein